MKRLLASPLHGLVSKRFLLLTFTGAISGKQFTTPVGYEREGAALIIVTRRPWWKNCQDNVPVTLQYKGRRRAGRATVISGTGPVSEYIGRSLQRNHQLINARRFGLTMHRGQLPSRAALEAAAFGRHLIKIEFQ